MPVSDCIMEYKKLGSSVFGSLRKFHTMRIPLLKRTKYDTAKFEQIIKDFVERRLEGDPPHEFKLESDLCTT